MRRIVLIIALFLLSTPVFSQKIRYIKLTDERWEFMTTDESYRPKGQKGFEVAFQVYNDINEPNPDNKLRFFLILTFNTYDKDSQIPSGGKLLIKTGKDEVISSINEVDGSILAYSPTTGWRDDISCHQWISGSYGSSYDIRGKYELTPEDITKIVTDGVIKIRVETNGESIDINLPLEETVKIGKEKKNLNRFGTSVGVMAILSEGVFNPLNDF